MQESRAMSGWTAVSVVMWKERASVSAIFLCSSEHVQLISMASSFAKIVAFDSYDFIIVLSSLHRKRQIQDIRQCKSIDQETSSRWNCEAKEFEFSTYVKWKIPRLKQASFVRLSSEQKSHCDQSPNPSSTERHGGESCRCRWISLDSAAKGKHVTSLSLKATEVE